MKRYTQIIKALASKAVTGVRTLRPVIIGYGSKIYGNIKTRIESKATPYTPIDIPPAGTTEKPATIKGTARLSKRGKAAVAKRSVRKRKPKAQPEVEEWV